MMGVSSLDIDSLQRQYQSGQLRPTQLIEMVFERIERCESKNIWITLLSKEKVLAQAARLENVPPQALPLYGLPFAVKDNIDVAGHPTTAACPEFSYIPPESATVVKKLTAAGALLIGKTNLDQFAIGLVGTRSPYGACTNAFNPNYISGGSSSGSAVAVATGLVTFSLGTDTAGSGRVPAGFNNIVGLKPSKGLISTSGVVPACRSLDCVSIFGLTAQDAQTILNVAQGDDPADPFSRTRPAHVPCKTWTHPTEPFRFGVPSELNFFGNLEYEQLYQAGIATLEALGGEKITLDFAPFVETAKLLYGGPWVAERLWAVKDFIEKAPEALHPITRQIIEGARHFTAVDVYDSIYKLQHYQKLTAPVWNTIDLLVVPTTGTIYTIAQVNANPLALNTNLGYYTNFVNLLDLCALAVPNGFQSNGLPMGLTFIAPAFQDNYLVDIARVFRGQRSNRLGARG